MPLPMLPAPTTPSVSMDSRERFRDHFITEGRTKTRS
jgi:hypothetical protein